MKFTTKRDDLLAAMQTISGVAGANNAVPILNNVLIIAENEELRLVASNMEIEMSAIISDVSVSEVGSITVPARKLGDICKCCASGQDMKFNLESNKMRLKSGKSQFTLSTLPSEQFPSAGVQDKASVIPIQESALKRILTTTSGSMGQNDARHYLNGLLLEFKKGQVRAVATDGHRMSVADALIEQDLPSETSVIVPRKGVLEILRLLGKSDDVVELHVSKSQLSITVGSDTITSKLIDGKFPDYKRVIPTGGDKVLVADKHLLKSAFQRAGILSNEKLRGVQLSLVKDQLTVRANNADSEQAEEVVNVEYGADNDLNIGFNVTYLLDALGALAGDDVNITLRNENTSILIKQPETSDCFHVVMPMRI